MTNGVGADAVLECVGTRQSMQQAIQSARPGAMTGYVGVPHGRAVRRSGLVLLADWNTREDQQRCAPIGPLVRISAVVCVYARPDVASAPLSDINLPGRRATVIG